MERTRSQIDLTEIAKKGDPYNTSIEIYKTLIDFNKEQEKVIKEKIKTAKEL